MSKPRWLLLLLLLLLVVGGLLFAGHWLTRAPAARSLPVPPALHSHSLVLTDGAGQRIAATALPGRPGAGAVLILHHRHSSRLAMWGRAQALQQQGVAVMFIDLPGHGDSDGERRGYGRLEVPAVRAAWDWMQTRWPAERKAVIGISLGAAAWVFADASPKPDAVVLEMLYSRLDEAVDNRLRLRLGDAGPWLRPLLGWQLPLWVGSGLEAHRPIDALAQLAAPLLLVAGSDDQHATAAQSLRLFAAAAGPKSLWMIDGAAHADFQAFDPVGYRQRVIGFLRQHLQQPRETAA